MMPVLFYSFYNIQQRYRIYYVLCLLFKLCFMFNSVSIIIARHRFCFTSSHRAYKSCRKIDHPNEHDCFYRFQAKMFRNTNTFEKQT